MKGLDSFSAPARDWFLRAFGEPTAVQQAGWPAIAGGGHALLLAPTGSGKTLAAFFWAIDQLSRQDPALPRAVRVLYVSPLKALVADIERNLRAPLVGVERAQERAGVAPRKLQIGMRTGDTSQQERRQQLKSPPDILITTPESLFLQLGSQARKTLTQVTTVIVDEVHALAPSKRGVHLALSLERLAELTEQPFQRIGLTATVRPHREAARFLAGTAPVTIVDHSAKANVELTIEVPCEDMTKPPSREEQTAPQGGSILGQLLAEGRDGAKRAAEGDAPGSGDEQAATGSDSDSEAPATPPSLSRELSGMWAVIYPRIVALIAAHQSVIVFVNSRSLCERMAGAINLLAKQEWVRAHHGSVSRHNRQDIEEALKAGTLRGIVATSSLELGIDMGSIDLVILIESPGSVARGLQRIGRAGHGVGQRSHGIVLPKHPGDLLEAIVVAHRMRQAELEPIVVPQNALDVLAQQLVAHCAHTPSTVSALHDMVKRAYPFEHLSAQALHGVLDMLSGTYPSDEFASLRPLLTWDRTNDTISGRAGTPSIVSRNGGTIVDRGNFGVFLAGDGPRVGELDEEMVHESRKGDVFTLGASAWRIEEITRDQVKVTPAPGQAGKMPFWRGEGPGRPVALGRALGAFCRQLSGQDEQAAMAALTDTYGCDAFAAQNVWRHLSAQVEATGEVPSDRHIGIEQFVDEVGDTRVCVLSPFGARVHAPWAMLLEASLPQKLGHAVEVLYNDDGIALRIGALASGEAGDEGHVAKALQVTDFLPPYDSLEDQLMQQLGQTALFASHFRENATRALLLLRQKMQGRTPLWQQRLRAKTLLAAAERYPSFPIVLETYRQLLRDVFDLPSLRELLVAVEQREVAISLVARPKPSPFARSLAYAYVQTYLYEQDAPVAERRVQALSLDYDLLRDLLGEQDVRSLLDAATIEEIESQLQCTAAPFGARDADAVFDLLHRLGDLSLPEVAARLASGHGSPDDEGAAAAGGHVAAAATLQAPQPTEGALQAEALGHLEQLAAQRRAAVVRIQGELRYVAIDDVARYRDGLGIVPPAGLPARFLSGAVRPLEGLLSRYARTHGPFTALAVCARYGLAPRQATDILDLLGKEQGFSAGAIDPRTPGRSYCHPDVLRRLKRTTLQRLRRQVAAVEPRDYARFLPGWQGLDEPKRGLDALETAIRQLAGLALPFGALIKEILPARVKNFSFDQLTQLCAAGVVVWTGAGALGPRDGRVRLFARDALPHLLDRPKPLLGAAAVHEQILHALAQHGPSFVVTLQQRLGKAANFKSLATALWDLSWAGLVTNDTLQPLYNLVLAPQPRHGRGTASASLGGRWSLVTDALGEPPSATERLHHRITVLLSRYGILSRNAIAAEQLPGGFTPIYAALKAMEDAVAVRRGLFVNGLSGAQFALPMAVERLRAGQTAALGRGPTGRWLAALDPAQPYGSLLTWPALAATAGKRRLRRVALAKVLLVDGEPHAYLEANGEQLWLFAAAAATASDAWRPLLQAMGELAGRAQTRNVVLHAIDGGPALRHPQASTWLGLGARSHIDGLLFACDLARPAGMHA